MQLEARVWEWGGGLRSHHLMQHWSACRMHRRMHRNTPVAPVAPVSEDCLWRPSRDDRTSSVLYGGSVQSTPYGLRCIRPCVLFSLGLGKSGK